MFLVLALAINCLVIGASAFVPKKELKPGEDDKSNPYIPCS